MCVCHIILHSNFKFIRTLSVVKLIMPTNFILRCNRRPYWTIGCYLSVWWWNRCVLRCDLKHGSELVCFSWYGNPFQILGPATEKWRHLNKVSVRGMVNRSWPAERWDLTGLYGHNAFLIWRSTEFNCVVIVTEYNILKFNPSPNSEWVNGT